MPKVGTAARLVTGNCLTGLPTSAVTELPVDTPERAIVRDVMKRIDLSQKAFALAADVPESHVSDALKGYRPIQWRWLWAQDATFWSAFWPAVRRVKGLTVSAGQRKATMQVVSAIQQLALLLQEEE